jgi:ABC-2 type transport system permease protein
MRHLRLFRRFFLNAAVRETEYRGSFFLAVFEAVTRLALVWLTFGLIYRYTDGVAGWAQDEVLVLVGVFRVVDGLLHAFVAPNMGRIPGYVRTGELDFHLLRPVDSQFFVSTRRMELSQLADVAIGLAIVLYAGARAGIAWSPLAVAQALVIAASGLLLLYAAWFAIMTCSFWLISIDSIEELFFSLWEGARYPVQFFSGAMRALFTFGFPVAFATTFPTEALLGRAPPWALPTGVALAAAALLASHHFWRHALRHYESASS